MYRTSLDTLAPGAILAKTIHDEAGRPLLVAGTELTERYIGPLLRRGVLSVHVRDGLADDVVPEDIVSAEVRASITNHVASTFGSVAQIAADRGAGSGGVDRAVADLGERPLDLDHDGERSLAQLYRDVEQLIAEIVESNTAAGLESLKTHSEYTFQHSVDVAVIGVLLGKHLGMPHDRLRELALGCLLHDLGKIYIDVAILDKPGKLTAEEFAAVEEHPRMGFELIRRMPCHSLLPAHVAYQHHEQQGGGGYPRGLVGDNRIGVRTHHERTGAGKMLLIAEIGAVADVYSALVSDRPYRDGMPPDQVAATIAVMTGGHLNRDVVAAFRQLVPTYPVGTWLEVLGGTYHGWRGVVTAARLGGLDQPAVRLVLDAAGEAVASPVEFDTRTDPDVLLRCLVPGESPTR